MDNLIHRYSLHNSCVLLDSQRLLVMLLLIEIGFILFVERTRSTKPLDLVSINNKALESDTTQNYTLPMVTYLQYFTGIL